MVSPASCNTACAPASCHGEIREALLLLHDLPEPLLKGVLKPQGSEGGRELVGSFKVLEIQWLKSNYSDGGSSTW